MKNYNNQAGINYNDYLAKNGKYRKAQYYLASLNLLLTQYGAQRILNKAEARDTLTKLYLTSDIAHYLFIRKDKKPPATATSEQIKEIDALLNKFDDTLTDDFADTHGGIIQINRATFDIWQEATAREREYYGYTDIMQDFLACEKADTEYLVNLYNGMTDGDAKAELLNHIAEKLQDITQRIERQRKQVYATYKLMNAHNIFIDMLADKLNVEALKIRKVDVSKAERTFTKLNTATAYIINAISKLQIDDAKAEQNVLRHNYKLQKTLFNKNSTYARIPGDRIITCYETLKGIDEYATDRYEMLVLYTVLLLPPKGATTQ